MEYSINMHEKNTSGWASAKYTPTPHNQIREIPIPNPSTSSMTSFTGCCTPQPYLPTSIIFLAKPHNPHAHLLAAKSFVVWNTGHSWLHQASRNWPDITRAENTQIHTKLTRHGYRKQIIYRGIYTSKCITNKTISKLLNFEHMHQNWTALFNFLSSVQNLVICKSILHCICLHSNHTPHFFRWEKHWKISKPHLQKLVHNIH